MKDPVVVLITSGFPYGTGEQFIENEIPYWSDFPGRVILLPENAASVSVPRAVGPGVEVSTALMERWHAVPWQLLGGLEAFFSVALWKEVASLSRGRLLSRYRLQHAFLSMTRVKMEERVLRGLAREIGGPIAVVYAYWMSVAAFAGAAAKRRGIVDHVVARAHGTDLYEHKRPEQYTALIRQFAPEIDAVYAISEDGQRYATRYGLTDDQVRIARLGVMPQPVTPAGCADELRLFSASSLTPFKQVHLIAAAVAELAREMPERHIWWHHAGAGEELLKVQAVVAGELDHLDNVTVDLMGHLPNAELLAWYATHPVDVFVNASSSEGIPVSIMEAMAHGIPAIGPDVGAMREIVSPELLLDATFTVHELAGRIAEAGRRAKDQGYRSEIRERQRRLYDAPTNFRSFISDIEALVRGDA